MKIFGWTWPLVWRSTAEARLASVVVSIQSSALEQTQRGHERMQLSHDSAMTALRNAHIVELEKSHETAGTIVRRLSHITIKKSSAVVQGYPLPRRQGYRLQLAFDVDMFAHERDESEREFVAQTIANQVRHTVIHSRFVEACDLPDDAPVPFRIRAQRR